MSGPAASPDQPPPSGTPSGTLADLLAGVLPPGTYRCPPARDVVATRVAVQRAGWRWAQVDGAATASRAELLDALGPALGLVGYHGRNLDALEECVRDLRGPGVLLWDDWGRAARGAGRTFTVACEILTTTGDREPTSVLLRGEGPGLPVPTLD